jgi:3-phenylpropionate/trans-cinnamate dioxygenase ferredoxin reductase subunit
MVEKVDFLMVGGGLTSAQAARSIREAGADGRIVIVSNENELPYNRPPLSKGYLQGKEARESILVKPKPFWDERNVEILNGRSVTVVDPAVHTVTLDDGRTLTYGKLLLATGSEPRRLDVPGGSLPGVHYLRTVEDSTTIRDAAANTRRAVIVGGGFIGTEVAASLAMRGLDVTLLIGEDVLLRRQIGPAAGNYLMSYFKPKGLALVTQAQAAGFIGAGRVAGVKLKDGREFPGDLVVAGVGVTPRTALAEAAGLQVDKGVLVDEHLRTSDPDIYAGGDIAKFDDRRYGHRLRIEHWDNARSTGKAAGLNMAGQTQPFEHLHYFFSDMFDLELEAWGDMYQYDEVLEQPAGSREAGHPAWYYLNEGRLVAGALLTGGKPENKARLELRVGRPEPTPGLRRGLVEGKALAAG